MARYSSCKIHAPNGRCSKIAFPKLGIRLQTGYRNFCEIWSRIEWHEFERALSVRPSVFQWTGQPSSLPSSDGTAHWADQHLAQGQDGTVIRLSVSPTGTVTIPNPEEDVGKETCPQSWNVERCKLGVMCLLLRGRLPELVHEVVKRWRIDGTRVVASVGGKAVLRMLAHSLTRTYLRGRSMSMNFSTSSTIFCTDVQLISITFLVIVKCVQTSNEGIGGLEIHFSRWGWSRQFRVNAAAYCFYFFNTCHPIADFLTVQVPAYYITSTLCTVRKWRKIPGMKARLQSCRQSQEYKVQLVRSSRVDSGDQPEDQIRTKSFQSIQSLGLQCLKPMADTGQDTALSLGLGNITSMEYQKT
ncbi:hypothetical protein B0H14DRAFT_2649423 [Mycena olivaceomarginata]|nr:hypothetical protein B0H14DRAFT_2649423 [Mycena olivaceomarginata]